MAEDVPWRGANVRFPPIADISGLRQNERMSRWTLALLALGIGVAVPAGYSVFYGLLAQRPLMLGNDVNVVNVLIVAAPFLLLAIVGARKVVPWAVALALTLGLWGYWLHRTVTYQWHPDGSGVDMGTIFLILTSWIWISLTAFAADAIQQYASSAR